MRRAGLLTLALLGFLLFARVVAGPLHAAGWAQPVLATVNGLAHLVGAPGAFFAANQMTEAWRERAWSAFLLGLAVNGTLYFGLALVGDGIRRLLWTPALPSPERPISPAPEAVAQEVPEAGTDIPGKTSSAPASPLLLSRRSFLRLSAGNAVLLAGATGTAGTAGYSMLVEPCRLPVTRHRFPLLGLPKELSGLRVVHLTDIHHGPWLSLNFVQRVVETANALAPDLVVVTGDHVVAGDQYIRPVAEALARLRPRIGVVSTLGNHDWWSGEGKVKDAFRRSELPLIDNSCLFLSKDRRLLAETPRSGEGLCLAGLGDLWEEGADFWKALNPAPEKMPRLVLSHNPDAAESADLPKSGERIDLMLCGHTHGGQIRLPLLGTPVVPSRFGQKYASGLVEGPWCPVYVSRGIGMTVLPLRLGVPPEIAVFEFYPA